VNGHLRELAARRARLVARSAAEREQLAGLTGGLGREIAVLEGAFALFRRVRRYRTLAGAAAGALVVLAPSTARRWLLWSAGIAPIAFEAYRLARAVQRSQSAASGMRAD
jgi:hypothetical protein